MDAFAELEVIAETKKGNIVARRTSYEDMPIEQVICQKIIDGFEERQKGSITLDNKLLSLPDKIVLQVAQIVNKHDPLSFINQYLISAMKKLGDGFKRGDVSFHPDASYI